MASVLTRVGLTLVVSAAVLYQVFLKDVIFNVYGYGRHVEPLSAFPYKCRRIRDPTLQACEDMWLHEPSRQLFLACSDVESRTKWLPNIARFNVSGRGMNDHVVAMKIDSPKWNSYEYRILKTPDFSGINGDGTLNLLGMTGETMPKDGAIRLWFVNARPSVDPRSGELLDSATIGGNSTIELFEMDSDAGGMKHLRTFADPQIATPNNIAANGDGSFYFTNDHGLHKVGLRHEATTIFGGGDVSYCDTTGCKLATTAGTFPNGLIRGTDGLIYVPSAAMGNIAVYAVQPDKTLRKVDQIKHDYPMDNLFQDSNGDIFLPSFPKAKVMMASFNDPFGPSPPSAIWRLRKVNGKYESEKIIEDAHGEALPGTTTAIHDPKTGRLFMSGVVSPFITVCEKL